MAWKSQSNFFVLFKYRPMTYRVMGLGLTKKFSKLDEDEEEDEEDDE